MNGLIFVVLLGILMLIFVALLVSKSFKNIATNIKARKILEILMIIDVCLIAVITIVFIVLTITYNPAPAIRSF